MQESPAPRIVVTVALPESRPDPERAARKNDLYAAAVERAGGRPVLVDTATGPAERAEAFATMDGLLLTGGVDIEPARYGRPVDGSVDTQPDRDALEAEAWKAAEARRLPVLGICRGLQAINVFAGGTLVQHLDGHEDDYGNPAPSHQHPLRVVPGTRLARILFPTNARGGVLRVNTYHHQAVRADDLAPGLVASGWASSGVGDLVEALETRGDWLVIGVQCHPERTESTPEEFRRLWSFFVDACRGPAIRRDVRGNLRPA